MSMRAWLRAKRRRRIERKVRTLNRAISGINPRVWPDVHDELWDRRARLLQTHDRLLEADEQ